MLILRDDFCTAPSSQVSRICSQVVPSVLFNDSFFPHHLAFEKTSTTDVKHCILGSQAIDRSASRVSNITHHPINCSSSVKVALVFWTLYVDL